MKAIAAPGMAGASRSQVDELTETAKRFGARGLVHLAVTADGIHGPTVKFLGEERAAAIAELAGAAEGDLVLVVADAPARRRPTSSAGCGPSSAAASASPIRTCSPTAGSTASRCTSGTRSATAGTRRTTRSRASSPRTSRSSSPPPATRTVPRREDPAGRARAMQYDLALNGWELGGGSVRIHRRDLLERSFALQGHSREAMHEKFGGMLEAFDYGAPPHGGIALGIDRWAMLLAQQVNIREVMAFPKTSSGTRPHARRARRRPDPGQYAELGLRFVGLPEKG